MTYPHQSLLNIKTNDSQIIIKDKKLLEQYFHYFSTMDNFETESKSDSNEIYLDIDSKLFRKILSFFSDTHSLVQPLSHNCLSQIHSMHIDQYIPTLIMFDFLQLKEEYASLKDEINGIIINYYKDNWIDLMLNIHKNVALQDLENSIIDMYKSDIGGIYLRNPTYSELMELNNIELDCKKTFVQLHFERMQCMLSNSIKKNIKWKEMLTDVLRDTNNYTEIYVGHGYKNFFNENGTDKLRIILNSV